MEILTPAALCCAMQDCCAKPRHRVLVEIPGFSDMQALVRTYDEIGYENIDGVFRFEEFLHPDSGGRTFRLLFDNCSVIDFVYPCAQDAHDAYDEVLRYVGYDGGCGARELDRFLAGFRVVPETQK